MSELQPESRVDHDPLLDFSIEPGAVSRPPTQPDQPVAASGVSTAAPRDASVPDTEAAFRARIERIEKAVDRCAQEVVTLRSEVATLVSVKADIKPRVASPMAVVKAPIKIKPSSRHRGRFVGAVAGIVLGIAAGMWIWTAMSAETLIPSAPIVSAAAQPIAVTPEPPMTEAPPAIIPVAAVTPVQHNTAQRESIRPVSQSIRPAGYVGTLSIDSDPPADVFIDRKAAGRTPLVAPNLKAGSHLVWIERDGYHRFTRVVLVPADRTSRVVADLEPDQR